MVKRRCPCHLPKQKDAVKLHAYALIYHIRSISAVVNLSLPYICAYISPISFVSIAFCYIPCCFSLYSRFPVFPLLFFRACSFCATHAFLATRIFEGFCGCENPIYIRYGETPHPFLAAPASAQIKMCVLGGHHRKKLFFVIASSLFPFQSGRSGPAPPALVPIITIMRTSLLLLSH